METPPRCGSNQIAGQNGERGDIYTVAACVFTQLPVFKENRAAWRYLGMHGGGCLRVEADSGLVSRGSSLFVLLFVAVKGSSLCNIMNRLCEVLQALS